MKIVALIFFLFVLAGAKAQITPLIPFEYHDIIPFEDGYAIAAKWRQYGVIDEMNRTVIPFNYHFILHVSDDMFAVEKDYQWKFVWTSGKEDSVIYDNVGGIDKERRILKVSQNGKWGILNFDLEEVVPMTYESIERFDPDGSLIYKKSGTEFGVVASNGTQILADTFPVLRRFGNFYLAGSQLSCRFYNLKGELVDDHTYLSMAFTDTTSSIILAKRMEDRQWCLLDEHLQTVHDSFESYLHFAGDSLFFVATENRESGVYDIIHEQWVLKSTDQLFPLGDGLLELKSSEGKGVVDLDGTYVIRPIPDVDILLIDDYILIESPDSVGVYHIPTGKTYMHKGSDVVVRGDRFIVYNNSAMNIYSYTGKLIVSGLLGEQYSSGVFDDYVIYQNPQGMFGMGVIK